MKRVDTEVEIEVDVPSLGVVQAEVRIHGGYAPKDLWSPKEYPDATVTGLVLHDDDGEPYDADMALLNTKLGQRTTLRDLLTETAIEKWEGDL